MNGVKQWFELSKGIRTIVGPRSIATVSRISEQTRLHFMVPGIRDYPSSHWTQSSSLMYISSACPCLLIDNRSRKQR